MKPDFNTTLFKTEGNCIETIHKQMHSRGTLKTYFFFRSSDQNILLERVFIRFHCYHEQTLKGTELGYLLTGCSITSAKYEPDKDFINLRSYNLLKMMPTTKTNLSAILQTS